MTWQKWPSTSMVMPRSSSARLRLVGLLPLSEQLWPGRRPVRPNGDAWLVQGDPNRIRRGETLPKPTTAAADALVKLLAHMVCADEMIDNLELYALHEARERWGASNAARRCCTARIRAEASHRLRSLRL